MLNDFKITSYVKGMKNVLCTYPIEQTELLIWLLLFKKHIVKLQ